MSTLSYTARQLYNMLTDTHCNCREYISVGQDGLLILANDFRDSYGVFEDIPIAKDFAIEYDLTLGSNKNPCFNPTFGSYNKPTSAQYYGFMLSFSEGGRLWEGENNSPTTTQQPIGMSSSAWYGTPNTTYHIKIERDDNTVNLYVDDVLTQTISDNSLRSTNGGYFGFFNWNGTTCKISNVTVTSNTYSNIKDYLNKPGLVEVWANIKNYVTAQLLGKAESVHTHTKSQITDFPSFGNTAGTICEGNDSRLSDTRTPTAHTHSASDITSGLATVATSGSYNDLSNKPTIPSKTSDLTNDSGFLTSHQDLSGYVPRSGGAVMTGSLLASSTIDSIGFGYGWGNGGTIYTYSPTHSTADWQGTIRLEPLKGISVFNFKTMTLAPSGTWTWNGTACQITSDQRYKQQITEIDDKLLNAWEDVELVQFKYNESVDTKGELARLHTGYVVQQINKACTSHGVDITQYGLFCHEEYPKEIKEIEVVQKDGTKTKETKVIREANEHYSLRYTEALIVECKYLRRCIARLTARIEELEKGNKEAKK